MKSTDPKISARKPGLGGRRLLLLWLVLLWCLVLRLWVASIEPNHRKIYDERFSVRNAAYILQTGGLKPENGFHPSFSYLPQLPFLAASELVFRATGLEVFRVVMARPGTRIGRPGLADGLDFSPTGYLVARGVSALIGTLSVYLCFLIGRRLFGDQAGLIAAFLLAAVPWHLRQSAVFKPDIVLVTTVLLALGLALAVVREPRLDRYLAAGAAVGLALSSKFNAPPAAIPLTVGSLLTSNRDRAWPAKLIAAGLAAVALFLVLNPFILSDFGLYETDFGSTLKDYGNKARAADADSLDIMASSLRWIFHSIFHGRWIATLAMLGVVGQIGLLLSPSRRSPQWRERCMLLSLLLGYTVAYSLASQNPEGWHNWLLVTPLTSILAAWVAWNLWRVSGGKLPGRWRRGLGFATALALLLVAAGPASSFAYNQAVPRTVEVAAELLASSWRSARGRVVASELALPQVGQRSGGRGANAAILWAKSLADLGHQRLTRTDAEVFRASRLIDESTRFYAQRIERSPGGRVHRVSSGWFRARGPDLVVLLHPWRDARSVSRGLRRDPETPFGYREELGPERPSQQFISVALWLSDRVQSTAEGIVTVAGEAPGLVWVRQAGNGDLFVTERVRVDPNDDWMISVKLGPQGQDRERYPVDVHPWSKPRRRAR